MGQRNFFFAANVKAPTKKSAKKLLRATQPSSMTGMVAKRKAKQHRVFAQGACLLLAILPQATFSNVSALVYLVYIYYLQSR